MRMPPNDQAHWVVSSLICTESANNSLEEDLAPREHVYPILALDFVCAGLRYEGTCCWAAPLQRKIYSGKLSSFQLLTIEFLRASESGL